MNKKRLLSLCTLAAAGGTAAAGTAYARLAHAAAARTPVPSASSFSARVDNEWFPIRPGTRYVYTGVKNAEPSRDVVTVTHQTTTIDGVPCVAVHDRLYLSGRLEEYTTDWYSQESNGNVCTSARTRRSSTSTATSPIPPAPGGRGRRSQARHLHARPPPRRPVGAPGVRQGSSRRPLQGRVPVSEQWPGRSRETGF
jgi:hypothetical protein